MYFIRKIKSGPLLLVILAGFLLSGCTGLDFWNQNQVQFLNANVQGLSDIPVYPGSSFLFKGQEDHPEVKKMLAEKKSAYHLPPSTKFEDVGQFYRNNLVNKGWVYIDEVKLGDLARKHGHYWYKDNFGLRIYQQINDVWYETITAEEAKTGLSDLVAKEKREYYNPENLIQLSTVAQTNWDFQFPDAWEVEQINSYYSRGLDLKFTYELGGFEILLQDLDKDLGTDLNSVAQNYLLKLNENKKPKDKYELYKPQVLTQEVVNPDAIPNEEVTEVPISSAPEEANPKPIKIAGLDAVEMILVPTLSPSKGYVTFVQHPRTRSFYAIVNLIGDMELYEYIKLNIKPV